MIDSIDRKIILLLGQNAQQSSEEIARKINKSPATVRRRLKRLIESGKLHIIGVLDPIEIGLSVNSILALKVVYSNMSSVLDALCSFKEITWVATTTGQFDILARGRFFNTNDLSTFLAEKLGKIKGIINSETFICMDVKKGREVPPPGGL